MRYFLDLLVFSPLAIFCPPEMLLSRYHSGVKRRKIETRQPATSNNKNKRNFMDDFYGKQSILGNLCKLTYVISKCWLIGPLDEDCCTSARCKYVPVMISRLHIHLKCFHRPISFQRNAEFETIRNHLCFISLVCFALYSLLFIWSFPSQNETIVILFRFYENYCISVVTWMP